MSDDVTPEMRAKMVMLSGLNWNAGEIAEVVGVSESSVYTHLNEIEAESKDADDWEAVYWDVILADVFGPEFRQYLAATLTS